MQTVTRPPTAPPRRGPVRPLTPRQLVVLDLLSRGVRVRAIAAGLGVSETTVRNHVREILRRLDCHSQLEAVACARRRGLL